MKYDVIIIGAGAAGLTAMRKLAAEGYRICMLEAYSAPGGRISTIVENGFDDPAEAGAEFIHGKMPYTFELLKEANISYEAVDGRIRAVQNGVWQKEEHDEHWDEFMKKLRKLKDDMSILQFLEENFSENKYADLRKAVINFAEGFDLADISKASVLSLKDEWKTIEKTQYRIKGGYIQLVNYLLNSCDHSTISIHFNACANKVEYHNGNATVFTINNRKFEASFVIVTISASLLQAGSIEFDPVLGKHNEATKKLGFGSVIKFLFWFKTKIWKKFGNDIGFLLTDEEIPTWWTQLPVENNLLTGWLGGPRAIKKANETDDSLLQTALISLSSIFHTSVDALKQELLHYKIFSWHNHPYIKGGYSYHTLDTKKAKEILSNPVDNTIFFAGEAFSQGGSSGTVESALQSGHEVAEMLIKEYLHKNVTSI